MELAETELRLIQRELAEMRKDMEARFGDEMRAEIAPVLWQWRMKREAWDLKSTYTYEVFATTDDTEVRALYAAQKAAA